MYICSQSRFDAVGQNGLGFAILCAREFLLWLCNPACGAVVSSCQCMGTNSSQPLGSGQVSLHCRATLGHVRERFLTIRCSAREIGDHVIKWQTVDESRQEARYGIDIS